MLYSRTLLLIHSIYTSFHLLIPSPPHFKFLLLGGFYHLAISCFSKVQITPFCFFSFDKRPIVVFVFTN